MIFLTLSLNFFHLLLPVTTTTPLTSKLSSTPSLKTTAKSSSLSTKASSTATTPRHVCRVTERRKNFTDSHGCVAETPVVESFCEGSCTSKSSTEVGVFAVFTDCTCCKPTSFRRESVRLDCRNGTATSLDYVVLTSCDCRGCDYQPYGTALPLKNWYLYLTVSSLLMNDSNYFFIFLYLTSLNPLTNVMLIEISNNSWHGPFSCGFLNYCESHKKKTFLKANNCALFELFMLKFLFLLSQIKCWCGFSEGLVELSRV